MKRSLLIAFCSLIGSLAFISESFAQAPARIAFVNSDRSAILAKTVGGKLDTIFTSGWGLNNVTKVRNLSVLASSADGKSLLIAGYFIFPDPASSLPDSAAIFARIDFPFTNKFGKNSFATPPTIGGAKVLLTIPHPEASYTKMLPLGCLTSDENEWYGIFDKSQGGNGKLWFFHGRFDGTGTVDSIELQLNGGGYHMTNMISSLDSKTMLTVVADQITEKPGRVRLVQWTPSQGVFIPSAFDALITSQQIQTSKVNPDWAFGFYLHILPADQSGIFAELAMDVNNSGNLELFKIRVINSGVNSLSPSGRKLSRSKIPLLHGTDQLNFFAGNTGNPAGFFEDHEVVVPDSIYALGNGGDMMSSYGGDSVVFITCASDHIATNVSSGIYIYDIAANTVYPVMNDETRMERQPIFMGGVKQSPPPYKVGKAIIDKTSLDFGSVNQGQMQISQVVLTETVGSLVKVTSAKIVGPDQGIFNVTSTPAVPTTIQGHGSLTFNISFTPTAAKTYNDTLEIHYQDSLQEGKKDSIIRVSLTGLGVFIGGVATSTPSSFDLSIVPNPFTSSTKITVAAREAGSTSIEIRDLLGKDIYSSKTLTLGEGEKFTYTLDAKELHLAPGTYFVIVRSGAEEATRQVIYIK